MRKRKRLMALLLTLALVMSFIPANIAKAYKSVHVSVTFNGPWQVGEESVSADMNEEVSLGFDDEISLTGFNSETMEAVLTGSNNFEATLIVDENGKTSLSTASAPSFPVRMEFIVRAKNSGGGGPQPGGNENEAKIVFRGINSFGLYEDVGYPYAMITYKNAENEDVFVFVEPLDGTTLEKRTEDIRNDEEIIGQRDVLITSGGDVVIYFEKKPKSACYNEFINGQPQTAQPVNFIINYDDEVTNEFYASLTTTVGSEYEVDIDFIGNGGGGGQQQPVGNKKAKINISGMNLNGSATWTGKPGYGHEVVETRYDRYWVSTVFAINENGQHGSRTNRLENFDFDSKYTDEEFAQATVNLKSQVIGFDREDDAETVDINVFVGNWGDRIDAIKINGVDYSNQLHLGGNLENDNIFDDETSMLTLFRDQGIYLTIEGVPVNPCADDGIDDEYNIEIAASPNPNCFIGNFLWSQDDYYAPIEMGGIEPSDKYIGKSTLTLMDIYYQDGTFDPTQAQDPAEGYAQLPFDDGWYKHIAVPENEKEYTNEEMPAIHYQLDRRGWNPETQSESGPSNSEMVMPTGTWVKMKIQPEQGYQVESFSGVNRNAGNVKILSDEADDACIFMFKIDSGNFHIGANVVPYENTADTEKSEAVSAASVDLEAGTLDGGTGELSVEDIQINEQDAAPYKDALAGDADDYSIEAGLDLSLNEIYLKGGVQDKDSDAAWRTEVGNTSEGLNEPAEITLSLDEDIDLSGKDVQIVHKNTHVNNGTETRYEGVMITGYDPETNAISFEAPSFSDYAILTKEAAVPEGNKAKLRINTTLGVMSNDQAVFTYKDGDETVGVVQTDEVVALEAEKDDKNNVVSQFMYTTNPGDSGVSFILEPANEYYKPQVLENGEWVDIELAFIPRLFSAYVYDAKGYTLTQDGTPVTDVQFRFVCTRTYDISFAEPTLTVGEGEEAITADVVGIQGFDEALTGGKVAKDTSIAGLGAKDNITLSGFDPERMVVRVTANNDETGWVKILTPKKAGDNYEVSLGLFDDIPAESDMLLFSLVEKRNDHPGPDGGDNHGDDAVLAFPESSQITFNENTSTATVTYINNQGEDVAVTVKPAEGTMLYKRADPIFDDQGTGEQPPEPVGYVDVLVTNGGQLTFEFSEEPLYAGYYMDDDPRNENPRGIDINNKTATFATEKGHAYEVCLDFGGNGGPDPNIALVRFHGAVDIDKSDSGVVTVTYLDDDDQEVEVTVTAQAGVIDGVDVNNWTYNGEEGTDYELYSTGGLLTIAFPDEPEHTLACWSVVQNGEPSEPVEFEFDENNTTSLATEIGNQYDVDISFRHDGPYTEILPASDSAEDVSAAEAAIALVESIMDGKNVSGITATLRERIEEAVDNADDITIDLEKKTVTENQVANDAKVVKANLKNGQKIGAFFDVDVNVIINGQVVGQITESPKPITISLELPQSIRTVPNGYERTYSVGSIHKGKFYKHTATLSQSRVHLSLPAYRFSTYVILYEDTPVKTSTGTVSTSGIYCLSAEPNVVLGMVNSKSDASDNVEFRWEAIDADHTENGWFEVSPWTKNNEWLNWSPKKSGNYVIVGHARVVGNPDSEVTASIGVVCHKGIKGICQMPYEGGGFLIGIESYDNPNQSYKYEMLILDCTLLAQGKDAWIYSTGKCGVAEGNALWTIWQPKYGYYWTLFRIYDENNELIDEQCFGFVND